MAIEKTSIKDVIDRNYAEFDLGLLCEEEYKSLKHIDMVVYTILNNQHGLSVKTTLNGSKRFVDKNGYIFISIGQDKLCKLLRTTRPTLNSSLKRLAEVGLVEVANVGNMQCNRIYVGKLKRTITLGDYMKDMSIGEEIDFVPNIEVQTINELEINKKASTVPPVKAVNQTNKNNIDTNIIPQNNKKYSPKNKENKKNTGKGASANVNDNFKKYDADELEKMLEDSQKGKFDKYKNTEEENRVDKVNITNENIENKSNEEIKQFIPQCNYKYMG